MQVYVWEQGYDARNEIADLKEIAHGKNLHGTKVYFKNNLYRKMLNNPYFGRIDFLDHKERVTTPIYIGLTNVSDKTDTSFEVYDWRSPISSLFYNHGIGEASYDAPSGKIEGEIVLRRQYKIEKGKLIRWFDNDLNINDEILQDILSNNSNAKMKQVVNTIQQEQNNIIRNVNDKYLIVQGAAGSGKTTVAMHRIAYLLYREENLTSDEVLILSPNTIFSDYIAHVLPDLGEENVKATTINEFARTYLKNLKIEGFSDFIKRYYRFNKEYKEDYIATKFKLSDEYTDMIDRFINRYISALKVNSIEINQQELNPNVFEHLLKIEHKDKPLYERIDEIAKYICKKHNCPLGARDFTYAKYGKRVNELLKEALAVDDIIKLYNRFLTWKGFTKYFGDDYEPELIEKHLKYDDLIGLLYLYFKLNGFPYIRDIKHIVIDEAQDYNITLFKIFKLIFPKASFTILGDVNQTINPFYKYESLSDLSKIFSKDSNYLELLKTYRSSSNIINYANNILGIDNVITVRSGDEIPIVTKEEENLKEQLLDDVFLMRKNKINRKAIITKTEKEALKCYNLLKEEVDSISLAETEDLNSEITIIPSYLVKGLEFDGVIIYTEIDNIYTKDEKYLYYVVFTRAMHQLIIYNQ